MNASTRWLLACLGSSLAAAGAHAQVSSPDMPALSPSGSVTAAAAAAEAENDAARETQRMRMAISNARRDPAALLDLPPSRVDAESTPSNFSWLLGPALLNTPAYSGAGTRKWKGRILASVRWGRFSFNGPRAGIARSFSDGGSEVAGASASLIERPTFKLNLGLRLDSGRKSGDDPALAGLPNIKRRATYTLGGTLNLTEYWSASATVSSDVKSTETGTVFSLGTGTSRRIAPNWIIGLNSSVSYADNHFMQIYYGVPQNLPPGSTLRPYSPGAGLRDIGVSASIRHQLGRHWVGFGQVGVGYLIGPAADSPLTQQRRQVSYMMGVAYNSNAITLR
jgi:outer membrane protein